MRISAVEFAVAGMFNGFSGEITDFVSRILHLRYCACAISDEEWSFGIKNALLRRLGLKSIQRELDIYIPRREMASSFHQIVKHSRIISSHVIYNTCEYG